MRKQGKETAARSGQVSFVGADDWNIGLFGVKILDGVGTEEVAAARGRE